VTSWAGPIATDQSRTGPQFGQRERTDRRGSLIDGHDHIRPTTNR